MEFILTVNAFMWREFVAEEKAKSTKKDMSQVAYNNSLSMTKFVEKKRITNKSFGTLGNVSKKPLNLAPKQFLVYSKAGAPTK